MVGPSCWNVLQHRSNLGTSQIIPEAAGDQPCHPLSLDRCRSGRRAIACSANTAGEAEVGPFTNVSKLAQAINAELSSVVNISTGNDEMVASRDATDAALAADDVVRAALAGVEEYDRVEVEATPPTTFSWRPPQAVSSGIDRYR